MIEQVKTEKVIRRSQCQPRGSGKTKAIALVEIVSSYRTLGDRGAISLKIPIGGIGLIVKVVVPNHIIFAVNPQRMMTPIGKYVVFDEIVVTLINRVLRPTADIQEPTPMFCIAAISPPVESVMVHPVVRRVFAGGRAIVKIVSDERAHPVSGIGAARIEITIADRNVVASIDAQKTSEVVKVDAIHRNVGLFIDIDSIGRVSNGHDLLVITRIDDPIAIRSPRVVWAESPGWSRCRRADRPYPRPQHSCWLCSRRRHWDRSVAARPRNSSTPPAHPG